LDNNIETKESKRIRKVIKMAKKNTDLDLTTLLTDAAEAQVESVEDALSNGPVSSIKSILARIVAVFAASGLSVIGAGAVVGISTVKAVILAGTLGVATVVEKLARGFLDDGKLTVEEINSAFTTVDKNSN
jgi:hypothetical protein